MTRRDRRPLGILRDLKSSLCVQIHTSDAQKEPTSSLLRGKYLGVHVIAAVGSVTSPSAHRTELCWV